MKKSILNIQGKIERLVYKPGILMSQIELKKYPFEKFNINESAATGIITFGEKNSVAYSKWVTPKRTRSYPFARIYDTYNFGGKIVTIIPIIKDEGIGASKNKSNNDRINYITLSWMNLMNIYVILAWYETAEKKSEYRITNQKFSDLYIKTKLAQIAEYKFDAHHWNREHFKKDFSDTLKNAVNSYTQISKNLKVKMHSFEDHLIFLGKILESGDLISLEKFADYTLSKSKMAAKREIAVNHVRESLSKFTTKGLFEMTNYLGGKYYLTADEIKYDTKNNQLTILESKNSTNGKLPSLPDIKDGLFKLLLFNQIKTLKINEQLTKFSVGIRLTGNIDFPITLPASKKSIETFCNKNKLSKSDALNIILVNQEASNNNYTAKVEDNSNEFFY